MNARLAILAVPLLAALACESATNLDVAYSAADGGSAVDAGDGGDAAPDGGELPTISEVEGCPCDPASGLGCCVTGSGAFCTNNADECSSAKGEWLRCAHRDPTFESECCWSGSGAGATTRFASACDGGPAACLTDNDCAGTGQPCKTVTCAGFRFGQCAANPPSCPSP